MRPIVTASLVDIDHPSSGFKLVSDSVLYGPDRCHYVVCCHVERKTRNAQSLPVTSLLDLVQLDE